MWWARDGRNDWDCFLLVQPEIFNIKFIYRRTISCSELIAEGTKEQKQLNPTISEDCFPVRPRDRGSRDQSLVEDIRLRQHNHNGLELWRR